MNSSLARIVAIKSQKNSTSFTAVIIIANHHRARFHFVSFVVVGVGANRSSRKFGAGVVLGRCL